MSRFLGKPLVLIILMSLTCFVSAQSFSSEEKKNWFEADKLFDYGDYLNAINIYLSLNKKDSLNEEINYKIGICYFYLPNKRFLSDKYFKKVNSDKFIESNYYKARLCHLTREYQKAIKLYEKYMDIKEFDRLFSDGVVKDLIQKSRTALLYEREDNHDVQINNIGEEVNSIYADYAPKISAEGDMLFFTSRRKNSLWNRKDAYGNYFENIFYSVKDSIWNSPIILNKGINSDYNDACTGISADGEKMLIFRTSEDLKSGDIYESSFDSEKWGPPIKLTNNINSEEFIETSACYSIDGNSIYFSSNREGGYGGNDLYVVKKLPNGSWGEAYNLGPNINTKYNETAPFIHSSGKKLFFSSEGHENMGGYDVFESTFDEYGNYNSPRNLKYPINTNDDDLFFVLSTDEQIGYLSSKRKGGFGSYDIYEVKLSENRTPYKVYKIKVFDLSNNPINKFIVKLVDLNKNKLVGKYKSNKLTGKMIVISEPNKEYEITIEAEGYESYKSQIILNSNYFIPFTLSEINE